MFNNLLKYSRLFFSFAIPAFIFMLVVPGWAACSCIENVLHELYADLGTVVFSFLFTVTIIKLKERGYPSFAYRIFFWVLYFIVFVCLYVLIINNAKNIEKKFPFLKPEDPRHKIQQHLSFLD